MIHLSSGLVQAQMVPNLLLTDSTVGVDLITQDKERNLGEFFDRKEGIQLCL